MSHARGRGRVVPRSSQTTAAVASVEQQQQQLLLPAGTVTALSRTASSSATLHGGSNPQTAVAEAAHISSSSDWRCAGYVVANSKPVQQLPADKLASGTARKLVNSGQPVLLKQLQLARCALLQHPHKTQTPSHSHFTPAGPGTDVQQHTQAPSAHADSAQHPSRVSEHQLQLPVLCSPAESNRFISTDVSKNIPGSYYHVRKPETSTVQMTFTDWLGCWQSWTTNRLLLQAHVCDWELTGTPTSLRVWPNKAVYPHLTQLLTVTPDGTSHPKSRPNSSSNTGQAIPPARAAAPVTSPAAAAAQHVLDWPVLAQLLQTGHWAPTGSLQLTAGGSDALLPARYETHDRLLCQVSGRQRVLLLQADQAFSGVYPYPVHHPYDRYSAVDWEDPELEHWPAAAQVQGLVCDLAPGDTLLVPAYCFVHSQLTQPACVSLEVHLTAKPARLNSPGALMLQVSRMMELWFGAEAGPANVRKWFQALSEGREGQLLEPQLLTTKGYKLLQCCHMALEQLQKVLALKHSTDAGSSSSSGSSGSGTGGGSNVQQKSSSSTPAACAAVHDLEAAARQFVARMCDGRLVPTPWLNEGITDQLYLQHPPQYYLIEEDAEAARYSSLFRHRLIANRPDWMDYATPLQLAPAGSKRSLIKAAEAAEKLALPSVREV